MPEHLRTVVAGIFKEIDDRVFRPIQEASNLANAMPQAAKSFEIFTSLWPAVLGALLPWMQDNPERLVAMGRVVADVWTSEEARRSLGDDAVSWFAAAQDARVAIAHAILKDAVTASPNEETMNEETMNEETIVHRCLVADFAILFGLFLVHQPSSATAEDLPVTIAKLAYEAAKDAYVLATTHRFVDPEPVASVLE